LNIDNNRKEEERENDVYDINENANAKNKDRNMDWRRCHPGEKARRIY